MARQNALPAADLLLLKPCTHTSQRGVACAVVGYLSWSRCWDHLSEAQRVEAEQAQDRKEAKAQFLSEQLWTQTGSGVERWNVNHCSFDAEPDSISCTRCNERVEQRVIERRAKTKSGLCGATRQCLNPLVLGSSYFCAEHKAVSPARS